MSKKVKVSKEFRDRMDKLPSITTDPHRMAQIALRKKILIDRLQVARGARKKKK